MPLAAKASMLSAHVVPPHGRHGTTEWADMRAAYDALSEEEEMKAKIAELDVGTRPTVASIRPRRHKPGGMRVAKRLAG